MIYVVEVPQEGKPFAWFAFEEEDLISKLNTAKKQDGWTIYETATPRAMLQSLGKNPETPGADSEHGEIFKLGQTHGWDTSLYRADYLLGQGKYRAEPVEKIEACFAAVKRDLKTCRMYLSDDQAAAELYRDPLFDGREGFYAHMALREQLIAMEVISDDM